MSETLPDTSAVAARDHSRAHRFGIGYATALTVCLILAIVNRWLLLDQESLWFDEGWTWWLVSHPAGRMFHFMQADTVAPIYFYLLHGWLLVFGDGHYALRSMSALFTTLSLVPIAFLLFQVLATKRARLVACLLIAIASMQSQYAREARPYAVLEFFTLCALACLPTVAARRSWPVMIAFGVLVAAGMYTHNAMGFYAVALAGAWLVWPGERPFSRRLIDLTIAASLSAALYAPWLPTVRAQAKWVDGNFWVSPPNAVQACVVAARVCNTEVYDTSTFFWWLCGSSPGAGTIGVTVMICFAIGLVLAACTRDAVSRRHAIALAIITAGPIIGVHLYSRYQQPIFIGRLFITSSALLPILLVLSFDQNRRRSVQTTGIANTAILGVLAIISSVTLFTNPQKENWRGAYEYVAKLPPSPRRLIVFVAAEGELPFMYYAQKDAQRSAEDRTGTPRGFFDTDPPRTIQRTSSDSDLNSMRAKLSQGTYDEVILVQSHEQRGDPKRITLDWLTRNWTRVEAVDKRHVKVFRFLAPKNP